MPEPKGTLDTSADVVVNGAGGPAWCVRRRRLATGGLADARGTGTAAAAQDLHGGAGRGPKPEPPSWLAWAVCVGTRSYGPEGAPAQQCVGATWLMAGVLGRYGGQVPFAGDGQPVGALAPYGAHPAFGVRVRPWRLRRGAKH